jgi:hypothetical protein
MARSREAQSKLADAPRAVFHWRLVERAGEGASGVVYRA